MRLRFLTDWQRCRLNTLKNRWGNRLRFRAPADPRLSIRVLPADIRFQTKSVTIKRGLGQVRGGNWEVRENLDPVRENYIVQGLRQRFMECMRWPDTIYARGIREKFRKKPESFGFDNIDQFIRERCAYLDRLYEEIKKHGYRSEADDTEGRNEKFRNLYRDRLEILVAIDRHGEILLYDGRHRFAIADILGLEVPVQVVCRHREWQSVRDEIHRARSRKNPDHLGSHPDLQDILRHTESR